jgi:glycosyltransferase involved in cell wall biosynthesis
VSQFSLTHRASRYEGWGLPSLEAMACGAAVVSTRSDGIEDFVVDGRNGLLSPVGDPRLWPLRCFDSCLMRPSGCA